MSDEYIEPAHRKHQKDLEHFCKSFEYQLYRELYWQSEKLDLAPYWNTSEEAKSLNWEGDEGELSKANLVWIKRTELREGLKNYENFVPSKIYKNSDRFRGLSADRFLFIIKLWKEQVDLPPPLLTMNNGIFSKIDGYHRICVFLLTRQIHLPFWIVIEENE